MLWGLKSKDFWPTIKPFLSKKAVGGGNEVILCEEDKVVSDQPEVCNIFNKYFVNVAKDIGKEADQYRDDFSDHPSIEFFLENTQQSNLNAKKATGADNISAKLLKTCAAYISRPISNLVNIAFSKSQFPVGIKVAQVLPLYKKIDPLNKENYRPVSILPTISKNFERSMHDQLSNFMDSHFNPFLAAFRKGLGCQSTLLRLLEDWRKALDSRECVAAILMDLS